MRRRTVRDQLFRLLFRVEFHELDEMEDQTELFYEEESEEHSESKDEVSNKLNAILELLPELDKKIEESMTGWTINRIGKVELTVLRVASYEMLYDDNVPESVAINEAIELAKKYGADDAGSFVNAVLGKMSKKASE